MQLFSAEATKDFKFCFAYKHKKNPSTLEIIGLSSFQHALPISPNAAKQILFHKNVLLRDLYIMTLITAYKQYIFIIKDLGVAKTFSLHRYHKPRLSRSDRHS